jgi:hypothetical protein
MPFPNKMRVNHPVIKSNFGAAMNFPHLFSPLKVGPYAQRATDAQVYDAMAPA